MSESHKKINLLAIDLHQDCQHVLTVEGVA